MKSMTGYGCADTEIGGFSITLEVNSVNKRGLDIHVSLPREWQLLERDVIDYARKVLFRGKVNFYFSVKPESQSSEGWNEAATKQALIDLRELAKSCDIPFNPDSALLLRVAQSAGQQLHLPPADDVRNECMALLSEAMTELDKMRTDEGQNLYKDLVSRIDGLSALTAKLGVDSTSTVPQYRDLLLERLKSIGLDLDLNDERVLREISIFADRVDTSEELTRLNSHIDQLRTMLSASDKAIGRPMDFLCQELNREINTIGSKANNAEITKSVLEMKNELEQVREQVQNVE